MGSSGRHPLVLVVACAGALALSACSSSANGTSGPGSAKVTPPSSSTESTPAGGTSDTGELFPVYTNQTVGYSIRYPGGWRIHGDSGSTVRIARFGDSISIIVRERSAAPSDTSYQKQLEALLAKHDTKLLSKIDQPASQFSVGNDKVTKAVIEQERPAGAGSAPTGTLITYRYLFWKDGKLVLISMTSVKGVDNGPAWDLIARSFKWQ